MPAMTYRALGIPAPAIAMAALMMVWSADATAQQLRVTVDQAGDFVLIGNTLGHDCGTTGTAPVVGAIGSCGSNTLDTAPDIYWQSDDNTQTALASTAIAPNMARSTAVLALPATASVTHAYLYWAGETTGLASFVDDTVTLERPDGMGGTVFSNAVTAAAADQFALLVNTETYFQAIADVTALVQQHGAGLYRASGFDLATWADVDLEISFASWAMVVFYEDASEPPRNLTLFDGLTIVGNASATATLSGFLVPAAYDAKLGVIAYEGDEFFTGDSLLFGSGVLDPTADALSNASNPADNFFNGTRSTFGVPVSVVGDLPQLAGTADTYAGVDFDVVDITSRVSTGQTSADIEATTDGDVYFLGAFVTSISTFEPNLSTSTKTVVDVDGEPLLPGDEMLYTIHVINTGNDNAINTVVDDVLPMGVSYKAGTLEITQGPNAGLKTDAIGDDQGEYDSATGTVTVRIGSGADASAGGTLNMGQEVIIEFVVTVDADATGTISNQATITAEGEQGAPQTVTPTDSDPLAPGGQPTDVTVNECVTHTDCGGPNNGSVCDVAGGYLCVPGCVGDASDGGCPMGQLCTSMDATIGQCIPDGSGGMGGRGCMGGMGGMGGDASGGMGGDGGAWSGNGQYDDSDGIGQAGSCGCEVLGRSTPNPSGIALLGVALLGILRRRRD